MSNERGQALPMLAAGVLGFLAGRWRRRQKVESPLQKAVRDAAKEVRA